MPARTPKRRPRRHDPTPAPWEGLYTPTVRISFDAATRPGPEATPGADPTSSDQALFDEPTAMMPRTLVVEPPAGTETLPGSPPDSLAETSTASDTARPDAPLARVASPDGLASTQVDAPRSLALRRGTPTPTQGVAPRHRATAPPAPAPARPAALDQTVLSALVIESEPATAARQSDRDPASAPAADAPGRPRPRSSSWAVVAATAAATVVVAFLVTLAGVVTWCGASGAAPALASLTAQAPTASAAVRRPSPPPEPAPSAPLAPPPPQGEPSTGLVRPAQAEARAAASAFSPLGPPPAAAPVSTAGSVQSTLVAACSAAGTTLRALPHGATSGTAPALPGSGL